MLEVNNLHKSYRDNPAVIDVSFSIKAGEMLGLLGPNGAGKSTTVAMIANLLRPDRGEVKIAGRAIHHDTDPLKQTIGLVPQDIALFEELTALANLRVFGALYGLSGTVLEETINQSLSLVGLSERAKEPVRNYSGGMKRRLNLAVALLHKPKILLLDEPTVGVDPQSRNAIFDNLEQLKRAGMALLYTTHYMEEAERLCDRIVIIDHGKVVANDTLTGLYRLLPASEKLLVDLANPEHFNVDTFFTQCADLPAVRSMQCIDGRLIVALSDLNQTVPAILHKLSQQGHAYRHVATERVNLEAVFLHLTGRSLRDN